jgi:hypothetical protein
MPVCPSVRMEQLGSQWTDFHEILYLSVFRKSVEKNQISLKSNENISTLHEDQHTFVIIFRSVLLRMGNVSDTSCRETQNTYFMFGNIFSPENRAVYETMWENIEERERPQMIIWRMRIACWILKATNTHSQNVILPAFPLQQWLHERISMLRCKNIACLATIMHVSLLCCVNGLYLLVQCRKTQRNV